jgi:glycosyltransferase involved in cell wall biosynthesis
MGYGEALDELKEITTSELNLAKRIHFMNAVPQKDLLEWTTSADVGIIPYQPVDLNNYFCSPNKLFEFIQAELPIIANDLPFLRAVVEGEGFGIVYKLESINDFEAAINKSFSDGGKKLKFYKENLRRSKDQYSWEKEEKKLVKIYESI